MSGGPRAVFFDRDDTLMRNVPYLGDPAQVVVFPGAGEAVRELEKRGFEIFLATNQSGVGRGLITVEQVASVNRELFRQMDGFVFKEVYCAYGHGATDADRKPSPQMVYRAARDHGLDLRRSYFVGDRLGDVLCGRNAGCRTVLVRTGENAREWDRAARLADHDAPGLRAAVEWILSQE
ncbi:MAG: HAD-IIIA family hydrolase [Verrucomicrobium sp.]|nr:HAD-IIIA family hydrolase [Verrucomicrobium sp.]